MVNEPQFVALITRITKMMFVLYSNLLVYFRPVIFGQSELTCVNFFVSKDVDSMFGQIH